MTTVINCLSSAFTFVGAISFCNDSMYQIFVTCQNKWVNLVNCSLTIAYCYNKPGAIVCFLITVSARISKFFQSSVFSYHHTSARFLYIRICTCRCMSPRYFGKQHWRRSHWNQKHIHQNLQNIQKTSYFIKICWKSFYITSVLSLITKLASVNRFLSFDGKRTTANQQPLFKYRWKKCFL